MRHTTTETHKLMIDLIDGIRRSPGLSPGVKHRAQKLREQLDGMGYTDGVYEIGDLHEIAEQSICDQGLEPPRRHVNKHTANCPPDWDHAHALSEMANHVIEPTTWDEIENDIIPQAVKDHVDWLVANAFDESKRI
tara:strand:+ start:1465 stop:1872 length:408 start_codon:yes stop_codon:yes gene_type:complete